MPDIAIRFNGVSKKYEKHASSMRESFVNLFRKTESRNGSNSFWALKDVSFDVRHGETIGIIGPNGAGKSTILKLLAGITSPTSGTVSINGRIGALLELGAGFHPEFTGRENIYLNGAILGMKRNEIDEKFSSIVDFAEISEFIDSPVKHYSSGMYVRLGFAIAAHSNPDILLVDEVLAVGDARFVQKCIRKFEEFQKCGTTIVFVSHDMNSIKRNCHKVILLDHGEIKEIGDPKEIVDAYNAIIFKSPLAGKSQEEQRAGRSRQYGSGQAEITNVALLNNDRTMCNVITSMENTEIKIEALFHEDIAEVVVGMTIRNRIGVDVYMTNTEWKGIDIPKVLKNTSLEVSFAQKMHLAPGEYTVNVAVSQKTTEGIKRLDWISDYLTFEVVASEKMGGICNFDSSVSIKQKPAEKR